MAPAQPPSFIDSPVFIIAEAGSNWRMGCPERDLQMARRLIETAAAAGANAVKFQLFRAETTYAFGSGPCSHLKQKGITEDIGAVFADLELPYDLVPQLKEWCDEREIAFMVSTFSPQDFAAVDPHVAFHKVASPELHHPELMDLAARSKKPTFVSTGASTQEEVAWAVDRWTDAGGGELALLQCTVQYPTDPKSVNLKAMVTLAEQFGYPVGLSDHTRNPVVAPVAAVALGARVIEKHFTLHRRLVGPDHGWAITGEELTEMVRAIRLAEQMMGCSLKQVEAAEEPLRRFSRRSLQVTRDVEEGERLELGVNYAILRPGTCVQGVHPRQIPLIEGAQAVMALKKGAGIQLGEWTHEA